MSIRISLDRARRGNELIRILTESISEMDGFQVATIESKYTRGKTYVRGRKPYKWWEHIVINWKDYVHNDPGGLPSMQPIVPFIPVLGQIFWAVDLFWRESGKCLFRAEIAPHDDYEELEVVMGGCWAYQIGEKSVFYKELKPYEDELEGNIQRRLHGVSQ